MVRHAQDRARRHQRAFLALDAGDEDAERKHPKNIGKLVVVPRVTWAAVAEGLSRPR